MVNSPVEQFTFDDNRVNWIFFIKLCGVRVNGKEIKSKIVVANCDPYNTYFKLLTDLQRSRYLDKETASKLERIDYKSPVCKIRLFCSVLIFENESKVSPMAILSLSPYKKTTKKVRIIRTGLRK